MEIEIYKHFTINNLCRKIYEISMKDSYLLQEVSSLAWKESIQSKYACGTHVDCIKEVYKKSITRYGCVGAGKAPDCVADTVDQ